VVSLAGTAHAQEWISVWTPTGPAFVGQDVGWHLDIRAPGEGLVTATVLFGDGAQLVMTSEEGLQPEGEGNYWADFGHVYTAQGFYPVQVTVSQGESTDQWSDTLVVWDLKQSASVKGTGTVWARFGGMYDQEFSGGLASFKVTAKRRAGTTATNVSLWVDVPNMQPDYPGGTTGMTFEGSAAIMPLYVERATGEVWIERVYGTVTNSAGQAGTAFANVHAIVKKGRPTLVRIAIWNTSAGYTYVDTGWTGDYYGLNSTNDLLLSGSVKI